MVAAVVVAAPVMNENVLHIDAFSECSQLTLFSLVTYVYFAFIL